MKFHRNTNTTKRYKWLFHRNTLFEKSSKMKNSIEYSPVYQFYDSALNAVQVVVSLKEKYISVNGC